MDGNPEPTSFETWVGLLKRILRLYLLVDTVFNRSKSNVVLGDVDGVWFKKFIVNLAI